ncbi:hypothetical protein Tco_1392618 [Tanacetum coccineum]
MLIYAELLWEGFHYSLHHPTSSIPYRRFTKIIISHYMTNFLEISRRTRDRYHNLKDDDIIKNIFNSGRYKDKLNEKIPAWMTQRNEATQECIIDVLRRIWDRCSLTQSQSQSERLSMLQNDQLWIHFRTLKRRSTRLTPPAPVPTVDKVDEMILQDTLQRIESGRRPEKVIDDSSIPMNDDQKYTPH